ncbi:hypothetical protein GCM10025786_29760 [Nocardioides caeni]
MGDVEITDADANASLRAERDALAQRCAEAEAQVAELTGQLAQARADLAAHEQSSTISLFDGEVGGDPITGDGSDPRVLSFVLGATAVVAGMVTLLALINGKLFSVFGLVMVALTLGLAWAAARTRVVPIVVSVVRGIVYVEQGETTYRFDIRKPDTQVEVSGRPGDPSWSVRFLRRGLDPFVVDASMVDPDTFLHQLREFRPEL